MVGLSTLVAAACSGDRTTVFVASSLTEVMPALIEGYERQGGAGDFDLSFAGSQTLAAQIVEGAGADLFVAANPQTAARVIDAGLSGRAEVLMENRLVVAVAADSPIATIEGLAEPGLRIAVGAPDVPVGALTISVLELLAARDAATALGVRANIVTEDPNVRVVLSRVELGEADAAFVYATDVLAAEDVRAIELPAGAPRTEYVAVLLEGGSVEAASLFDYLLGDDAAEVLRAAGFEALSASERSLR